MRSGACKKPTRYELPKANPLKFMGKWRHISKTQALPQEQDITAYKAGVTKAGVMRRNDEGVVFEDDS